jgi:tRNA A-37 threonylcarbamoyl transferase component Bud32
MTDESQFSELDLSGVVWLEFAEHANARACAELPSRLECRVLRHTPRRRVLCIPGAPGLLIKQYFYRGPIDVFKTLARRTPALREWRALREAERRRLPVPKPLALGRGERQSLLVTEFVEPAVTLEDFVKAEPAVGIRRRTIREIAVLIRTMHDAGLYQRDLHPGNLLLRERDSNHEYFLIDLQRIDLDPFHAPDKRWRDLAAFAGGCEGVSRLDRRRFFKSYLAVAPRLKVDESRLSAAIERSAQRRRLRLWRSRQKRCLAGNREFAEVVMGSFRGFVRRSECNEALEQLIEDPPRLFERAIIVKDSLTATVGSVVLPDKQVFIKRYNLQGPAYALKNIFRSSRARRGWKAGNSCVMRRVGVALPLVYLERRRFRFLCESYVLTAGLPRNELSQVVAGRRGDLRAKRGLVGQLARHLRSMHDRGVAHRDLKAENIIARDCGGGRYEFFIVDFDGMSFGAVPRRVRAKNLARMTLAISRIVPLTSGDRLRFIKHYLGDYASPRWRQMYRDLVRFEGKRAVRRM